MQGTLTSLSKWFLAGSCPAAPRQVGSSPTLLESLFSSTYPCWLHIKTIWRAFLSSSVRAPLLEMLILISRGGRPGRRSIWGSQVIEPHSWGWVPLSCRRCHSEGVFVMLWVTLDGACKAEFYSGVFFTIAGKTQERCSPVVCAGWSYQMWLPTIRASKWWCVRSAESWEFKHHSSRLMCPLVHACSCFL